MEENKKVAKKTTARTNRIIKRRKQHGGLEKELSQFHEIRDIIELNENPEFGEPAHRMQTPNLEVIEIPLQSPGIDCLQASKAFSIFTEDSLQLSKFVDGSATFYGRSLASLSDRIFRKFVTNLIYELRHTESDKNKELSLYVLYLLSVTQDLGLLESCHQFLRRFPCQLTTADILPILANYGADLLELCGPYLQLVIPSYLVNSGKRRTDFPVENFRKVFSILTTFADSHLILCDATAEPLVVALAKLSLDHRIRRSTLLPLVCCLLTKVAVQCEEALDSKTVAAWLILAEAHPLNQLDISRISLRPVSPILHHALIGLAINSTLKFKLKFKSPFQISDFKTVLNHCTKKKTSISLLQLYTVFELLIASLPFVTADSSKDTNKALDLPSVDGMILGRKKSADFVRLRAVALKLRSLITLKFGERFALV